jgi:2-hydroxychromene-2-carboxylate isomerase
MSGRVEFWFEFASSYSYLAAWRIADAAARRGVEVVYRPFLLGPIFAQQGWSDSPFNLFPAKGRYMWRDIKRLSESHLVPFRRPSVFPRSGLLAARLALVAADGGFADRFVPAAFAANFARDEDIADRGVLRRILVELGLDADALLAQAVSLENKTRLREQTERAAEIGIFGAPSFVVDGELFWGNDRLEQALAWARRTAAGPGGSCGFPNEF